ncbi:arylsulfatase A family protein [Galbibacter orientalis DSM 19592]|uniref:Arylsulfatase A family protein n=1 Tax=Galbibacter orientalis DSM 19592 TaxID=926559 RepID=I3CAX9_9FLAO|nr:arylsulfatase [Galbibacter orientalis]EIJ40772.1 arylsulfatase A family protein [Galbibacter orientalis DSM 19592]
MKYILTLILTVISVMVFAQQRPNVIVVLADDIGIGDVSYYRKKHSNNIILETPTIDRLAKEGMIFTNAHTPAALCAPTRYAIMTGNHCYRSYAPWGVWGSYQQSPIQPDQLTLGTLMKNAGYQTAFFGKWGFGMDFARKDNPNEIYRSPRKEHELDVDISRVIDKGPLQNGFDYSFMYPAGIQAEPYAVYENGKMVSLGPDSEIILITKKDMLEKGVTLDKKEGLGDSNWNPYNSGELLVNKAVNFIESTTDKSPFFMYYCSQAVHLPHTPSEKLNGTNIAGTTPSNHLDMVKELDVQMEMIINALKQKGVYDNTLIIFTSDNGGLLEKETIKSGHKSNDIFRGGKNQMYEGGHRVPFIAWWPREIKAKSVSSTPILGIDILGTLAEITNQKLEGDNAMDSSSLLPVLKGKTTQVHPFLMTQSGTGKQTIIIKDEWKLIIQIDKKDYRIREPIALFNLKENPTENEEDNFINNPAYKDKVDELFRLYNETRDSGIATRS